MRPVRTLLPALILALSPLVCLGQAIEQLNSAAGSAGAQPVETRGFRPRAQAPAGAARSRGSGAVMLQGFHWESHMTRPWWGVLASKAQEIASAGFDLVWFPPSSAAMSDEGYLPNRLFVQDSAYGTTAELKAAVAALHRRGVKAVADVVINHRVGTRDWADFTDPAWGPDAVCSDDEWAGARGAPDTGKGYHAARDIDHSKAYVQESVKAWLSWLRSEIGYDGWRFDYVRGVAPRYFQMYAEAASPAFAVGEIWDDLDLNDADRHRRALADWLDSVSGRISVFDFTTKGVLQHAVGAREYWRLRDSGGGPPGLIGWRPAKAVTFVDNHDTGASTGGGGGQNHWPFPGDKVMQGYAYILTHPGVPCVYWPHYFDWGLRDQLRALIALRKAAGVGAESAVSVAAADRGRYAAFIDGKVAVKIGPDDWSPGEGWRLAAHGKDYAVWTRLP
ncbi:MAG: alpha-amylase [Elusimicrobia bacterium]|nr:alpha-amylase [Elusimicrobiota bacterium]